MAMQDDPNDVRRRKNIVPRSRSYFPAASRFMGVIEPSPTGTYFNPARYGRDLTPSQLRFAQRNLANVYNQDVRFNRVANPRFQTEQDTGYSSTAPFGSGRATAATTQRYAQRYGRPTADGLMTFDTPSGGSITYRPTARQLAGGVPSGGAQPLGYANISAANAYQIGYGGTPDFLNKPTTPYERSYAMGFNVPGAVQRPTTSLGYQFGQALGGLGTLGYNAIASLFRPRQQSQPTQSGYADNSEPRRYFDF